MKRRLLIQEERTSLRHPHVRYAIVAPPPHFVKAEMFTVFPDLVRHMDRNCIALSNSARGPSSPTTVSTPTTESGSAADASLDEVSSCEPVVDTTRRGPFCLITFQQVDPTTDTSLIAFSDEATEFKDDSRDQFFDFMKEVQARLHLPISSSCGESSSEPAESSSISTASASSNRWFVDWVDPATGLPVQSANTSSIYCESDGIEQLLKMGIVYVNGPGGGCRLVDHPRFGINVYPATGFVCGGTSEELLEALAGI